MEIAVTSSSFSRKEELKNQLLKYFPVSRFNSEGLKLEGDSLAKFVGNAQGWILGLEKADAFLLKKCPNLKIISKYGVGLDNIDLEECKKNGVTVGWTSGVNKLSVAEMILGFMLALSRNLFQTAFQLKNGIWNKNGGFQLSGKTVGIIGVGNIGKEVVRLLKPFACSILVNDIVEQKEYYHENNLTETTKEGIFRRSDFVTIHTPLTSTTRHLVNDSTLKQMKPSAYLINTARGGIVDQVALKKALQVRIIAGAALDVYDMEPPTDEELLRLTNLITTPHIGGNSKEAVMAMGLSAINHLKMFFSK